MKKFIITEDERKRIKNLYEQTAMDIFNSTLYPSGQKTSSETVAKTIGFSQPDKEGDCWQTTIYDGKLRSNIISNVCNNGYFDIKNTGTGAPAATTGQWTADDKNVKITLSDGKTFSGSISEKSLQSQIAQYITSNPNKFKAGYIGDTEINSLKGFISGQQSSGTEQTTSTEQGGEPTQTSTETPSENKVAQIQQKVIDAGLGDALGPKGKDGRFGPYTADAVLQLLNKK
jgi:hypothetical protein